MIVWLQTGLGSVISNNIAKRAGSWWERTAEVDVVAVSDTDGALLVGECKWSVNPVGTGVLDDLLRKAALADSEGR